MVIFIASVLAAADQFIKHIVINNLKHFKSVSIIDNFLRFTYVENRGAAFGILQNSHGLFIIMTVILLIVFIYSLFIRKLKSPLFMVASTLIIGGGLGNLIDRIYLGYVVDYIELSFFPPVFNFADICVCIGAIVLIIYLFLEQNEISNSKVNEVK